MNEAKSPRLEVHEEAFNLIKHNPASDHFSAWEMVDYRYTSKEPCFVLTCLVDPYHYALEHLEKCAKVNTTRDCLKEGEE